MKKAFLVAVFGVAVMATVPANATTASFNFTDCSSGGTSCSSTLSSYGPVSPSGGSTLTGITATVTALVIGSGSNTPGSSISNTQKFAAAETGSYSGAGIGVCETSSQNNSGNDCAAPNHQVDNGANTTCSGCGTSNNNSGLSIGADDFEFLLIQISSAVDLSQLTLGNYGVNGTSTNPFAVTYYTSASLSSLSSVESLLEGVDINQVNGTAGFGAAEQEGCTTGTTTSTATNNSSCAVNTTGVNENLNGTTATTYLLIAASIASTDVGNDYFKLQGLSVTGIQSGNQSATPEPATFGVFGFALVGLGLFARKRKLS